MNSAPERPEVGGALSLDLLNTVWQTTAGATDWLDHDAAVVEFTQQYGQATDTTNPDEVEAARGSLRNARELIDRLVTEGTDAEQDGINKQTAADVEAALHGVSVQFVPDVPTIQIISAPPHQVAVEALLDAIRLLADRPDRIRTCHHNECTLRFVDTSKAGRRRWCSMEACGNRNKAKRHYERTTASKETPDQQ